MYKLMIIIGCDTSKKAWKFQITFEKKKMDICSVL